jgi:hypothetical protein
MADANVRPTRADEVRQERRRQPGATVATGLHLTVDETKLDRKNFSYRWAKDFGGRMPNLHGDDWDPAPEQAVIGSIGEGTVGTKIGGTDEGGKPYNMVLLRKRKDWYDADRKEKQRPLDEMDAAIKRGTNNPETNPDKNDGFYTPDTGKNTVEVRSTR